MRSLLFVPADDERKIAKAAATGADAVVLDLEDAVLPDRKLLARAMLPRHRERLSGAAELWVRVNDRGSGFLLDDLAAVAPLAPQGIVLPKIAGPEDIDVVSCYLDMAEAVHGIAAGSIGILAVCTETPSAVLRMAEFISAKRPRLKGMLWGGEDLSAALGAGGPRAPGGSWLPLYEHARSQCLLACHALGIDAIDTVYVDFRDGEGCRRSGEQARHSGFTGKVAIHPDQVPIINEAFTPSADEVDFAQRVIAAFAQGRGAVALDGKMLDVPHLKAAQRLLRMAAA